MKFGQYVSIYYLESRQSMFKKILEKLKFGSCKIKSSEDANTFKESKKKQEDRTK